MRPDECHMSCAAVLPPPVPTSLIGWFTAETYNPGSRQWLDLSGRGNHAFVPFPEELSLRSAPPSGPGALKGQRYVHGSAFGQVLFPPGMLSMIPYNAGYTLFHLARYDGPARQAIFTTDDMESYSWHSGFSNGNAGVADGYSATYHKQVSLRPGEWLLSSHRHWYGSGAQTPYLFSYGAQGVASVATGCNDPGAVRVCINCEVFKASDWAVAAVLVYNDAPSGNASADPGCCSWVREVEDYLAAVYGVELQRRRKLPGGCLHGATLVTETNGLWHPPYMYSACAHGCRPPDQRCLSTGPGGHMNSLMVTPGPWGLAQGDPCMQGMHAHMAIGG